MAFTKKKLRLTFTLGKGATGEDGQDRIVVEGMRIMATITKPGGETMGEARLKIYGMSMSNMNRLSALNTVEMVARKNSVSIEAGDESGMSLIFSGQITLGLIDMGEAPSSSLVIVAHAGYLEASKLSDFTSYSDGVNVAAVMQDFARRGGYSFEANGVSVILGRPYYWGSLWDQIRDCARAADINWQIDNGTLAIWPKGGSRTRAIQTIGPGTGMVGYPSYSSNQGIAVETLFTPSLVVGGVVSVESAISYANGHWVVFNLRHELDCEVPDGRWFTRFDGSKYNADALAAAVGG